MSTTTIHRLEKNKSFLIMLACITFLTYNTWRMFGLGGIVLTNRLDSAPFAYRMNWYIVSVLSQTTTLSIITCMAVIWILSMSAVYLILRPIGQDLLIFLCWLIAIALFGAIYDGEAFILLALIVKYRKNKYIPFLLIPLIAFKEEIAFIALVYLIMNKVFTKEIIVSAGCSGLLYVIFRLAIGELPYLTGAPFFTPPVLLSFFNSAFLITWIPMTIILILLTFDMRFRWLWIIAAIPIFLFALFWEPHLWFPIILIQIDQIPIAKHQEHEFLLIGQEN